MRHETGRVSLTPLSPTKFHNLPLNRTVKAGATGARLFRGKRGNPKSPLPTLGGKLAHLEGRPFGPGFRDSITCWAEDPTVPPFSLYYFSLLVRSGGGCEVWEIPLGTLWSFHLALYELGELCPADVMD